jgi:trk system potassium uptake protein TrkA
MHVVIAGCGRVGSGLAKDLVNQGFEVSIIDENPDAFSLLGDDFPGEFVIGRALDWEALREAGIEGSVGFVACTDGDNTNIVVAQIAQKKYGIQCAIARVYDPLRAELYAQAGIRTMCPTKDVRVALFDAVRACQMTAGPAGGEG